MRIIIVGVGKVGEALVQTLIKENHDIVVIDINANAVTNAVNKYDVMGLVGSGLEQAVLENSGIDQTDFFISVSSHDEVNLLSCVLAKKLGAKHTVARVREPKYYSEMKNLKDALNIDLQFNPEKRTAMDIFQVIKYPSFDSVEPFANGKALMAELKIREDNPLVNKSIKEIFSEYGGKVLFAIVERGGEFIIPSGDFVFAVGDIVRMVASENGLTEFVKSINIYTPRAKNVFLVGGGSIAVYLTEELIKLGINVKIVESDKDVCSNLASELKKATIILGDGSDQEVLLEEGIKRADACVTLTGIDEENVIISLFAKGQGVKKVITKVDRPSILNMVKQLGLETVASPRLSIAGMILRYIRSNSNESGSIVNSIYKIADKVETIEFTASDGFEGINVPLKDLKIKKGVLICGIVRGNEFIVPYGSSFIMTGDKVIVVAKTKAINSLEDIVR